MAESTDKPTIVVAGATSSPASQLPAVLGEDYRLVGLTRRPDQADGDGWDEWRRCDLFSSIDTDRALDDADIVVHLAHSARPSARLTQASATDLDILCADNLARSAAEHDVDQIVHVSTILHESDPHAAAPEPDIVSETLGQTGIPVTTLDTDLVLGSRGTTTTILRRLVERLPVLVCPRWMQIPLRIVEVRDLADAIADVLDDETSFGQIREISPSFLVTYRQMLRQTAELLGHKRWFVSLPFSAGFLSAALVATVAGQPIRLMRHFVSQLREISRASNLPASPECPDGRFEALLRRALEQEPSRLPARRRQHRSVRSVQRLPAPTGHDAMWAVDEYLTWLPDLLGLFMSVDVDAQRTCRFYGPIIRTPALILEYIPEASRPDRQLFRITGGFLARPTDGDAGEFEFRLIPHRNLLFTAIQQFQPALPWSIYVWTQARIHLRVMQRFGRHIAQVNQKQARLESEE